MGERGHPGPPGPPGEQGLPGAAGKEGTKVSFWKLLCQADIFFFLENQNFVFSLDPFGQMGNFSNRCFSESHTFRSVLLELRQGFDLPQMEHRGIVGSNPPRPHGMRLPLAAHCSRSRLKAPV